MSTREPCLWEIPDGRTTIIRVDPVEGDIPDLLDPPNQDRAVWMVGEALGDSASKPVRTVWRRIRGWKMMDANLAILWALCHPETPFGLAYKGNCMPSLWHDGLQIVIFRGQYYTRNAWGVLTPEGGVPKGWPSPEGMRQVIRWWSS